ncbi:hypothetical protein BJ741DRAFT_621153 [Chytriomyces cf. hyalinus JEL632]|nr:hypothetical protein BJ741DRAFT_621153 [Chytriomyces cf. hyalinus JEL632]
MAPQELKDSLRFQILLCAILAGLPIESSLLGSFRAVKELWASKNPKFNTLGRIILACNIFCFLDTVFSLWGWFLQKENCLWHSFMENITSHLFLGSCDALFLYIAYRGISGENRVVLVVMLLTLLNRFVWAVIDLVNSGGLWDEQTQQCFYFQDTISGIGYNIADVICELSSTIIVINYVLRKLGTKSSYKRYLLQKNAIRSLLILVNSTFVIWSISCTSDDLLNSVGWAIQVYINMWCVNIELLITNIHREKPVSAAPALAENDLGDSIRDSLRALDKDAHLAQPASLLSFRLGPYRASNIYVSSSFNKSEDGTETAPQRLSAKMEQRVNVSLIY